MTSKYEKQSDILKALAHPARLQIVIGLMKNECNVTQIQEKLGFPQSTISQHLKILKNSKIIKGRRETTQVCYKVTNNTVIRIINILNKPKTKD
ncbi:winged helix-turn-helix transcriptional regulator [candidate division WOR-3 bacterium]|nr:winged helix-turn-helix transcriptional regulator [candidate division WOR-3 bacterium]